MNALERRITKLEESLGDNGEWSPEDVVDEETFMRNLLNRGDPVVLTSRQRAYFRAHLADLLKEIAARGRFQPCPDAGQGAVQQRRITALENTVDEESAAPKGLILLAGEEAQVLIDGTQAFTREPGEEHGVLYEPTPQDCAGGAQTGTGMQ